MASSIEVRPTEVDPAAVRLLGIEKIVDGLSHGAGESFMVEEAVSPDEHEPAKSRDPDRALPIRRKGTPTAIFTLAVSQCEIVGQKVRCSACMQQHTQRVGDKFQILWPGGEAPAVALLQKKGVLISDELIVFF